MEMLKSRESLEEKWKQKGLFSSVKPKSSRNTEHVQPVNRYLLPYAIMYFLLLFYFLVDCVI